MERNVSKEMNKLVRLLVKADIPFEVVAFPTCNVELASIQICCPSADHCRIDAVSHYGTYGYRDGLIETMSDMREDVDGWLTAEEAFKFFEDVWNDERSK